MELPRLPKAVCLTKQKPGKNDLGQGGDQEPNDHSDKMTEFLG
jgi:hypothetical protein